MQEQIQAVFDSYANDLADDIERAINNNKQAFEAVHDTLEEYGVNTRHYECYSFGNWLLYNKRTDVVKRNSQDLRDGCVNRHESAKLAYEYVQFLNDELVLSEAFDNKMRN